MSSPICYKHKLPSVYCSDAGYFFCKICLNELIQRSRKYQEVIERLEKKIPLMILDSHSLERTLALKTIQEILRETAVSAQTREES